MENIIKAGVVVYAALFLNVGAAVAGKDCTNTSSHADHSGADSAAEEDGSPLDWILLPHARVSGAKNLRVWDLYWRSEP